MLSGNAYLFKEQPLLRIYEVQKPIAKAFKVERIELVWQEKLALVTEMISSQ